MISGIGVDLVEIDRMQRIMTRWGDRFLQRVFTGEEISYCRSKAHPAMHFAARFAAKEACLKALGLGLGMGMALSDMEIVRKENGVPTLSFSEHGRQFVDKEGIRTYHVSLTHTNVHAMAMVIMEK